MVGIALYLLKVPLALPLTVLEFFASFVPLIGSPVAMAVATVVALAGRGVVTAVIVLVLIVVFGQIEGHVLQPFVMGWSVRLHPVAVAISVAGGTLIAGLPGAVAAVPLVSIAYAVMRELRSRESPPDASEGEVVAAEDGTVGPDELPGQDTENADDRDGGDEAAGGPDEADPAGDSDASSAPSDAAGSSRGNAAAASLESPADPV
jgi:hypothetical protein